MTRMRKKTMFMFTQNWLQMGNQRYFQSAVNKTAIVEGYLYGP
jgi:hypothetical protein